MSPVLASKNGATTEAAESVKYQLHSQDNTTPQRENQKI
jgi:hypothetical protein